MAGFTYDEEFFVDNKRKQDFNKRRFSEKAIIVGPVFIGNNVKIGDFCKIVGPSFIGDNSVIGDYSMIRESQIGQDCLIGSFTEVARSYISNNVFYIVIILVIRF